MKHKNNPLAFFAAISIGVFFLMSQCSNEPYYSCDSDRFVSNTWIIEEYGTPGFLTPIIYSKGRTCFKIESDTTFIGNAGCNEWGGKYRILDGCTIELYDVWSTLVGCFPLEIMSQERAVFDIVVNVNAFRVGENLLLLETPDHKVLRCTRKLD